MKKLFPFLLLPFLSLAQFGDVPDSHPHSAAIEYVQQREIVSGYEDQTYKPDQTINRVEFLKILLETKLPNSPLCETFFSYPDVDWSSWYGDYVQSASCQNIVSGYPDGSFGPANTINYAESAKIISGVYDFDVTEGSPWYQNYVSALVKRNATPRLGIRPDDLLTRGEMAEIIYRLEQEPTVFEAPNILLIIADDLGLDASPWHPGYGSQKPNTPNLDALAQDGLVFENVWSNPVCSPTRGSILTGKYGVHTGVLGPVSKDDPGILLSETSLQSLITEQAPTDYAQAVIGKWHLSTDNNGSNDNPNLMGVPHYSGLISGGVGNYSNWRKVTNGQTSQSTTYATTEFTNDAIDWVDAQNKPWFLWLAYTAPHTPFHLPPKELISDQTLDGSDIESNPLPYYFAAIEAMDSEIGRLLNSIDPSERDNTVIIFMGDNGTPNQVVQAPFSKGNAKGSLKRGGINVPFMMHGPNIGSGREDALVNTSDLFATIADLSGVPIKNYENSYSLVPLLTGGQTERDSLYAEINTTNKQGGASKNNGWTVQQNSYKYTQLDNGQELLFNITTDPYEQTNLANNGSVSGIKSELQSLGKAIRAK